MKKIQSICIVALLAAFALTSCNYTDLDPTDMVGPDKAFGNVQNVHKAVVGIYGKASLRSKLAVTEYIADDCVQGGDSGGAGTDLAGWVYTATSGDEVVGYAVETMSKQGFGGAINLMVGFTPAGEVINVNVLKQTETPGLGTKMADEGNPLLASIQGQNLAQKQLVDGKLAVRKDGGDVDALTAATISSRAYVDAINRAWMAYKSVATGEAATDVASGATNTAAATSEPAAQEGGQNE